MSRLISVIEFLGKVANAANYASVSQTARVRLSRTSAVLVGFYIFHAVPNYLLLSREGRRLYSYYCHINTNSVPTRLVEIFLGGAMLLHAFLGIRKSLSTSNPPLYRNSLFITGGLISGLISMHLMDFRFTPFVPKVDKQVLDLLNKSKRSKNLLYWLFVLAVAFHAFKGVSSPAWIWRLGFRGKREINILRRLSQALIIVSTFLYIIPLTMDSPYGNAESDSPKNSEIIIVRSNK
jgi:succinate dehydrogenase/fumarate reductase cytochrome b subunit